MLKNRWYLVSTQMRIVIGVSIRTRSWSVPLSHVWHSGLVALTNLSLKHYILLFLTGSHLYSSDVISKDLPFVLRAVTQVILYRGSSLRSCRAGPWTSQLRTSSGQKKMKGEGWNWKQGLLVDKGNLSYYKAPWFGFWPEHFTQTWKG